jgi:hypothetical protein
VDRVQLVTLAFMCELHGMLCINKRFGSHYRCHLQGECVMGPALRKASRTRPTTYSS